MQRSYSTDIVKRFQLYGARALCNIFDRLAGVEKEKCKNESTKYVPRKVDAQLPITIVIAISEDPIPRNTFDPPIKEDENVITFSMPGYKSQCLLNYINLD